MREASASNLFKSRDVMVNPDSTLHLVLMLILSSHILKMLQVNFQVASGTRVPNLLPLENCIVPKCIVVAGGWIPVSGVVSVA